MRWGRRSGDAPRACAGGGFWALGGWAPAGGGPENGGSTLKTGGRERGGADPQEDRGIGGWVDAVVDDGQVRRGRARATRTAALRAAGSQHGGRAACSDPRR